MDIVKFHAAVVHFAIAFPVALLILDLYYWAKKRPVDGVHAILTYLSFLAVLVATSTGFLSYPKFGKEILDIGSFHIHRAMGLALNGLYFILASFRFLMHSKSSQDTIRKLFTFLLVVCLLLVLYQGKLGGIIVYDHLLKR